MPRPKNKKWLIPILAALSAVAAFGANSLDLFSKFRDWTQHQPHDSNQETPIKPRSVADTEGGVVPIYHSNSASSGGLVKLFTSLVESCKARAAAWRPEESNRRISESALPALRLVVENTKVNLGNMSSAELSEQRGRCAADSKHLRASARRSRSQFAERAVPDAVAFVEREWSRMIQAGEAISHESAAGVEVVQMHYLGLLHVLDLEADICRAEARERTRRAFDPFWEAVEKLFLPAWLNLQPVHQH